MGAETIRVRRAAAADARQIAVVHVETWQVAYRGLIDQDVLDAQDVDVREALWANRLAVHGDDPEMVVAEVDGRVVGWATYGAARDDGVTGWGELAGLYVHPDASSRGVGRALVKRVESELRAAGWSQAYLWVLSGNERAIAFYEARGWHSDGLTKRGDAGGALALLELRHSRRLM